MYPLFDATETWRVQVLIMIKLVFCLRRLPSMSVAEFQRYWVTDHADLVRTQAAALRLRRYTQNHTFSDPRLAPAIDVRGGRIEPFDGVAELCWDSVEDLGEAMSTPEGLAAAGALLEDEKTFIDLPNSPLFFSTEQVIVGT